MTAAIALTFHGTVQEFRRWQLWLLEIAGGQAGVFVRVKLAGTLLVLSTLMFMWKWRAPMLFPVTTSIASCQTCLMIYLTAA